MSINVVVSGTAAGVSVSGGTSVAITVGGGIGPAGFLVAPGTATNAFGTFQLTAGDGITISTSAAQFQVSSYGTTAVASFAPVQSVAGRVGSVVLQASDVTAGTFAIARIPTISYTALANVPATFSPSAHTHSTSDVVSFTAAAAAAAPVQSVAGRSGAVSLAVADISGLAAVASSGSYTSLQNVPATFSPSAHTHSTADITGITGSFAAASHTHDAAAITRGVLELARIPTIGFTALAGVPATFAPQAHTHSTADVVGLTASFSQVGHTHDYAVSVHTHSTADITGYSSLPAQAGKAGPLVTDGTAATWATRYSVVDPVLVQGSGMTLTRDTSAGSITVAFAGGTSGVSVSSATPQPLGTASAGSSGDASRADHVHLMPSAADVGAAATGHSHPYVQVLNGLTGTIAISGGEGVTVSTASSSITIAAAGSYSLPTASSSVLGGVKVGSGLTITSGVLAATGGGGLSWSSVPASATATGTAGNIAYDNANGFFYVATATDTWKRAALATWPLDPYWSSVSLLLNGDGNLTDRSTNSTSITAYGNVAATGSAKYGSGSMTFDGSGDYLAMTGPQFAFGTADFTMEAWLWVDSHNNGWRTIMGASTDPPTSVVAPRLIFSAAAGGETTNGLKLDVWDGSTGTAIRDSVAFPTGEWVHIALVRQSGTARLYRGGVQVGSTSMTRQLAREQFFVGRGYDNVDGEYFAGRIDELRVTKGICRYPDGTTFTPSTTAFPNA